MAQNDNAARFRALLAELLMLDQADLDFGIYRIMNARRAEITRFLDEDLLPQIHEELQRNQTGDRAEVERELNAALEQLRELGVPEESSEKVRALRAKLADSMDVPRAEREVFNHLYNFLSRYYQEGDFLSLRRYKRDVYALPYEGEEVRLHWANADQYYIKTSEFFRDYSFTLVGGRRVYFKLAAADTEQNNNKATGERRFMLASASDSLRVENDELIVSFAYEPDTEKRKQADINRETVKTIFGALGAGAPPAPTKAAKKGRKEKGKEETAIGAAGEAAVGGAVNTALLAWAKALMQPIGTNGNPERTTIEKHLNDYTAKNSFDYFIHKDLSGFLRRELDFYIKNEVMFLDDIEHESAARVENYLAIIRAIRRVGLKIIEFLASLEDFQKRLWLKKKFVIDTHWCVTLDRVPEEFYPEIIANERQHAEWVRLFAINDFNGDLHDAAYSQPLTAEFLRSQPHLVLDTSLFEQNFTERLLAMFENIEGQTSGVLIKSENFQALSLLQARYLEQIQCVHIDPPYNTASSGFLYKNEYQHSSWLAMMQDRYLKSISLLKEKGSFLCHIDEYEKERLYLLLEAGKTDDAGTMVWDKGAPVTGAAGLATQHEYVLWRTKGQTGIRTSKRNVELINQKVGELLEKFSGPTLDAIKEYRQWLRTTKILSKAERTYDWFDKDGRAYRSDNMSATDKRKDAKYYEPLFHPVTKKACPVPDFGWRYTPQTLNQLMADNLILFGDDHTTMPRRKTFLEDNEDNQVSSIFKSGAKGKVELDRLHLEFPFAHPTEFYKYLIEAATVEPSDYVLDFFAGSGTTGHAIIDLNREDGGARKFILIEMGEYFHTVTKPRVLKVIYSRDWRDGKPTSRVGSSCLVKILRLESYEDTLNNLTITRTSQQSDLLALHDAFREQYTLRYFFERETASSPSLLNLDLFENPFDYRLDVSAPGSSATSVSTPVDLIETFNYLLGLRVARRYAREGFRIIEGAGTDGSRTLIIWRNAREQDNVALNRFFTEQGYGTQGFSIVYANGDHTLGMTRGDSETWQDRMIEMDFKRLMFEEAA